MENDLETVEMDSIDAVIDRVVDVIGDRDEALRWMGTPVQSLGYATPISVMATSNGKRLVLALLDRLRYGVW